jgi:mannose-6-phosphate isomerase-like protein (cupin superfamily)
LPFCGPDGLRGPPSDAPLRVFTLAERRLSARLKADRAPGTASSKTSASDQRATDLMPLLPVYKAGFTDLPREVLFEGAFSRSAARTEDGLVVFNWLTPGLPEIPPHSHDFDQLALILSGSTEFDVAGCQYTVSAGEFLYIPRRARHSIRVVGGLDVFNIDIFAPVREDYLHLVQHQPDLDGTRDSAPS